MTGIGKPKTISEYLLVGRGSPVDTTIPKSVIGLAKSEEVNIKAGYWFHTR
jgi:hypothetical protein